MTAITTTAQLKESILATRPTLDTTVLEDICKLTRIHQLKWVPNKDGKNPHYIMSQLSVAKGLDSKDYANYWSPEVKSTSHVKQESLESLPGKAIKLEGDQLAIFKKLYQDTYNESLGKINQLWVGNWEHAYAYLIQGKTSVAKDFQSLGAKSIQLKVEEDIQKPVLEVTNKHIYQSGYAKEDHLARDLCYLSAMTPYTLKCERSFPDFPGSKTKVRRFDLIHSQPHKTKKLVITCYELKRNIVDYHDLVDTVEAKRYIEVLKKYFNTEHVNLIMVAPFGGSKEALDKAQQYDNVEVWTTRKLTLLLLEKARAYHKLDSYFVDNLEKECDTVKKLLVIPQVIEQPVNVLPFEKPIKKIIA
ncbi:MAG: hypothetical protein V7L13_29550 [Nostoc sp.]|uniref:hypothetical protein n=1 Tax=Nostoc sp. TaxID=1180 RepID=UPI002FFA8B6F